MNKVLTCGALLAFAACSYSPEPSYYTLAAVDGATSPDLGAQSIKVQRPMLAGYLDRPELVQHIDATRLVIDDGAQWAEPLDRMIERVLAEDLQKRLPQTAVSTESDARSGLNRFSVALDIAHFDVQDGQAILNATLTIRDSQTMGSLFHMPVALQRAASGDQANDLSALLGDASDQVKAQLLAQSHSDTNRTDAHKRM